jgi:hypothetical protein
MYLPPEAHASVHRSMEFSLMAIELLKFMSLYTGLTFTNSPSVVVKFACNDNREVLQGERLARLNTLRKEHEESEKRRRDREREARPSAKRFTGTCHNW